MFDRDDSNRARVAVNPVDQPKVAAPSGVKSFEIETQRLAHALRVVGKRSVGELNDGDCNLFR
jgi:hypothetical protein